MGSSDDDNEEIVFDARNLSEHYEDHRFEWPDEMTEADYKERALRLLTAVPDLHGEMYGFTRRRNGVDVSKGDRVRYDPVSNEYATMTQENVFKTLFRPRLGEDYYLDDVANFGDGDDFTFTENDNDPQGE
jgi:pyocin large subunit-like protein